MKSDSLHNDKKTLRTTIIALLIVSALLIPAIAEINTTGTYFWISPKDNIYADVSNDITISINIANAPETFAWKLKLSFNATVLSVNSATEGNWLTNVNSSTFFSYSDAGGYLIIEDTFTRNVSSGASGNGWLCDVEFHVDASGRSELNLYDTELVDMNVIPTGYPNNDGFFCSNDTIDCLDDVRVVSVEVNETEVQQGDLVNITVVVHNEGNHTNSGEVTVTAVPKDGRELPVLVGTLAFPALTTCQNHTLIFIWNTNPVAGELYTIVATATITGPADDDPHDNEYIGPEIIVVSTHDIKITDKTVITPSAKRNVMINFTAAGGGPVTVIAPCQTYTNLFTDPPGNSYDGNTGMLPPPSTWWHILVAGSAEPYEMNSVEFHVDSVNLTTYTFHIDKVILANGTEGSMVPVNPALWVVAEQTAKIAVTVKNEGKVAEDVDVYVFYEDHNALMTFTPLAPDPFQPCTWYLFDPMGLAVVEPCTWWHIIDAPAAPWLVSKEFHIDVVDVDVFHIDFTWPDEGEPIEGPILAVQEKVIGIHTVSLAPGESKTIYYHWLGLYSAVPCGEYSITAFAYPVPGEEIKNYIDNKYYDGTIEVQFSDVSIDSLRLLTACTDWQGGVNPTVVPEITLTNTGCQDEKLVVYYIADPNLAVPGDQIVFGIAVVGPIHPGQTITFVGCSPFGGWDRRLPSLAEPYNVPVPGTNYSIIAQAIPSPGFEDDDMSDNTLVGIYGPPYGPGWHLPVIDHDVGMYIFKDGLYWEGQVHVVGEYMGYGKHVYRSWPNSPCLSPHGCGIDVTVFNQGPVTENFTVTVQNGTGTAVLDTAVYNNLAAGANTTVTLTISTEGLATNTWYILDLVVNVTIDDDDDPCDNYYFGYSAFKVRILGDVNGDGSVKLSDVAALNLIFSLAPGFGGPPYFHPITGAGLMPDINGDNQVKLGDVAKLDLIFSLVLPGPC